MDHQGQDESERESLLGASPYLRRPSGPRDTTSKFAFDVRSKNRSTEKDWDALCAAYRNNARRCFDHLAMTPRDRPIDEGRVTELKGRLAGVLQYEVGGAARVWYRVYDESRVVVVESVGIGHPKETE